MDELTQLRKQNRELSDKLDRQVAAWNANGDALTAHTARQAQRIAELEADIARKNGAIHALDHLAAQLTAQLAAVPVTLLRYIVTSHPSLPIDDRLTAQRWLNSLDGTHD